jgi:hypothetical protein
MGCGEKIISHMDSLVQIDITYFSNSTVFKIHTGCLKIREFRNQSMVEKDPVELEKYLEKKVRSS